MKKRMLTGVMIAALLGCTSEPDASNMEPPQNQQHAKKVPFTPLAADFRTSAWQPHEQLQPAYFALLQKQDLPARYNVSSTDPISSPFPPKELDKIDFQNQIGLFLTRGVQASSPFTLKVLRIEQDAQKVTVHLELTDPKGAAPDVFDYRYTLLAVHRADLPKGEVQFLFVDQNGSVIHQEQASL